MFFNSFDTHKSGTLLKIPTAGGPYVYHFLKKSSESYMNTRNVENHKSRIIDFLIKI